MKSQIDAFLARTLSATVDASRRHALAIIFASALLTLLAGAYTATHIGVNSDNVRMVAADLPSRINHEAFARLFPNLDDALLIVVDADTPELARESAQALLAELRARTEHFQGAYMPGGGTFFETHGLLYRDVDDLDAFGDQMARLQPILAALEVDPSLANLAALVQQGLEHAAAEGDESLNPDDWSRVLDSVGEASVAVYTEHPLALSWEQTLLQGSAVEVIKRRVIVAHPILDFDSLLPARNSMAQIREAAAELGLDAERGVRVRITGNPALNYEEMFGIGMDLGVGGVFCFFVVIAVLTRALRSFRLVLAAVTTLLSGLVWTAAFAALVVVDLTLVSAAFGVLFIGLGVDFAIHLGMAYAQQLRDGRLHPEALRAAAANVGSSLAICTVTTAIGFYVFVPTDFRGVGELGLIAGSGMFIILGLTLTLFPALLTRGFALDPARGVARALHFRTTWWRVFDHHPMAVCSVAALLFMLALMQFPKARFEPNVIELRDPETESVQAFDDLLAESGMMSPWFVNSVAPDPESASVLSERMRELETVSHTLSIADYVPADQEDKLDILADIAFLLDVPVSAAGADDEGETLGFDEQVAALRRLHDFLAADWVTDDRTTLGASMRLLRSRLGEFLARVETDERPEEALAKFDELLLSGLPEQLARVRAAVNTDGIEMDDLPEELVERMVAHDGSIRVQVFPAHDLSDEVHFARFTDEVLSVDPRASGVAINLVDFARATRTSFRQALISAVAIISVLLLVLWRRLGPTLLVMTPLVLSSSLTVGTMALFDIPFNFANVVVIPLLLGIGVDSGIHLVHRADTLRGTDDDLMDSTTARAVFYSALTTTISFGTLALSSHRGMQSLGMVLSIGMTLTVLCNLLVLPSMLRLGALRGTGERESERRDR